MEQPDVPDIIGCDPALVIGKCRNRFGIEPETRWFVAGEIGHLDDPAIVGEQKGPTDPLRLAPTPAARSGIPAGDSGVFQSSREPLLHLPNAAPIVADMFAGGRQAARAVLDVLSDTGAACGPVYDNLDQGWALRVLIEPDAVFVLAWDWEATDPQDGVRILCLCRRTLATQAIAARSRLDHLHAALLGALGPDLWSCPARE